MERRARTELIRATGCQRCYIHTNNARTLSERIAAAARGAGRIFDTRACAASTRLIHHLTQPKTKRNTRQPPRKNADAAIYAYTHTNPDAGRKTAAIHQDTQCNYSIHTPCIHTSVGFHLFGGEEGLVRHGLLGELCVGPVGVLHEGTRLRPVFGRRARRGERRRAATQARL